MPYNNIPLRPRNRKFRMEAKEMDCLTWYVLSGCKKEDAFGMFVKPDLVMNKRMLKEVAMQFFASADARDYISAYRATLEGKDGEATQERTEEDVAALEAKARKNIRGQVTDLMLGKFESIDQLSDTLKAGKDVGIMKDEEVQEQPRRYLPTVCSMCEYKLCVENAFKNGDIIDCCQYCRALEFANERGFVYDKTKLLNIPKEDE